MIQMTFYAMPCASVLVLELLRQIRQPKQHMTLNRSTIIQDISVLISSCDWLTESGQGNYEICKQAQSLFSRSLDQILNWSGAQSGSHGPNPVESSLEDVVPQTDQPTESMDFDFVEGFAQNPEWSAWLDSFDLQADPWLLDPAVMDSMAFEQQAPVGEDCSL